MKKIFLVLVAILMIIYFYIVLPRHYFISSFRNENYGINLHLMNFVYVQEHPAIDMTMEAVIQLSKQDYEKLKKSNRKIIPAKTSSSLFHIQIFSDYFKQKFDFSLVKIDFCLDSLKEDILCIFKYQNKYYLYYEWLHSPPPEQQGASGQVME